MLDYEKVKEIAQQYLDAHPLDHPDYVWTLSEGRECKSGWYFPFQFKCIKNIPEEEWERFAGAPGFIVSKNNKEVRPVGWAEFQKNDF
jgi:hypothetical protein